MGMSLSRGPAWSWFGLPEKLFLGALAVGAASWIGGVGLAGQVLIWLVAAILGIIVIARGALRWSRLLLWRLRNRLIVAYLFIAVIPLVLLLVMAQLGTWALTRQVGTYLLNAELDRRITSLRETAVRLANAPPADRAEAILRAGFLFRERFPGIEILVRDQSGRETRYPPESDLGVPPTGFMNRSGVIAKDGYFHLWAHQGTDRTEVVIVLPVTRAFLGGLVPGIGDVTLRYFPDPASTKTPRTLRLHPAVSGEQPPPPTVPLDVPAFLKPLDWAVPWSVTLPISVWDEPQAQETSLLAMRSPISRILDVIFRLRPEDSESDLLKVFYLAVGLFVVVQILSAMLGISLTRSITSAVHELYEGTERVKEGDFAHRIRVSGHDQLAELGQSFNRMTANLEKLLISEKERQRMQAELEIAREVQSQLHPKALPGLGSLRLTSLCTPARMVSGDYYDYQAVSDHRLVIAIGDVAGKGISAALLMATLQSAMRSQLRHCMEASAQPQISTARLVANLNTQLHASTSPEKFATFFFGVYDDETGLLHYTNAGHLPPVLFGQGRTKRLEVNGMVVGAFPDVPYGESSLRLEKGDLMVCFTDGITEPENAYGEMYGEDRLIDLVRDNLHLPDAEIVNLIVESVQSWMGIRELPDDMTLLLARKV